MAWGIPNLWGNDDNPWSNPWGGLMDQANQMDQQATASTQAAASNLWQGAQNAASTAWDWWNQPKPEPTIPEPSPAATTATPPEAPASRPLTPDQQAFMDAQTSAVAAEAKSKAAEAALAEARIKELEDQIRRRNDPNSIESQTATAQLATAQASLARAQHELGTLQNGLTPEAQIRLTDQLARERSAIEARARATEAALVRESQLQDRAGDRQFQLGLQDRADARTERGHELQLQLWQDQKSLRLYEIMLGQEDKAADRALRAEEMGLNREMANARMGLDRERLAFDKDRAAQDFQLRMMAQKVAEGELSAKKAFQKFEQWIQKQRLPSEIARNKSAAYAPFMPYLTNAKKGDIPMGFEAGGSMDRLHQMAGASYNPQNFAINPVSIDDIKSGNVGRTSIPAAPASGGGGVPMPSAAMPTPRTVEQIKQALGG